MVNVLVWDNGNEKSLVEVVVNKKVVYSVLTFNLFSVLNWVQNNITNDMEQVKVIYKQLIHKVRVLVNTLTKLNKGRLLKWN